MELPQDNAIEEKWGATGCTDPEAKTWRVTSRWTYWLTGSVQRSETDWILRGTQLSEDCVETLSQNPRAGLEPEHVIAGIKGRADGSDGRMQEAEGTMR